MEALFILLKVLFSSDMSSRSSSDYETSDKEQKGEPKCTVRWSSDYELSVTFRSLSDVSCSYEDRTKSVFFGMQQNDSGLLVISLVQ